MAGGRVWNGGFTRIARIDANLKWIDGLRDGWIHGGHGGIRWCGGRSSLGGKLGNGLAAKRAQEAQKYGDRNEVPRYFLRNGRSLERLALGSAGRQDGGNDE